MKEECSSCMQETECQTSEFGPVCGECQPDVRIPRKTGGLDKFLENMATEDEDD